MTLLDRTASYLELLPLRQLSVIGRITETWHIALTVPPNRPPGAFARITVTPAAAARMPAAEFAHSADAR